MVTCTRTTQRVSTDNLQLNRIERMLCKKVTIIKRDLIWFGNIPLLRTCIVSKSGFLLYTRVFGFGKGQTRVSGRVWSRICVHCKLEGGGSAVAVDGWVGRANFFGTLSIISCCKIANIVGMILWYWWPNDEINCETFVNLLNVWVGISDSDDMDAVKMRYNELLNPDIPE